ncbi:MAG: ferredoxin reductase [Marmoricola sp.]|nr:ferredoxin reductase [Marmoricola sp.]
MNLSAERVVIVGAGHGGANAAALLRQHGFDGDVVLLSEELDLPYQRPPLSKSYLKAQMSAEELLIRPESFYGEQRIDLRLGTEVDSLDLAAKKLTLGSGEVLGYDVLVLATGAVPRRLDLPGSALRNVHELRTRGDAHQLSTLVQPGKHLAVVGGGYVGLEVAASSHHLGGTATVIEREDRVLARVASPELAAWLDRHHREQGTEILTAAQVAGFLDRGDGSVGAVALEDGRELACDGTLVGVGALPHDRLARDAGLACDGGVVVDGHARTSDPAVFAVGDVTRRPLQHYPGSFRLESIPSAVEQAKQAVSTILGQGAPKPEVPWFWSDQFDVKVKIVGLLHTADTAIVRGDQASGRFAMYHCEGRRVRAVETVNSGADFMLGKQLIDRGTEVDLDKLRDPGTPLKELAS